MCMINEKSATIGLGDSITKKLDLILSEIETMHRSVLAARFRGDFSAAGHDDAGSAFHFDDSARTPQAPTPPARTRPLSRARPALPDPRLVRRIIRERQLRRTYLAGDLLADPAWDMLLDLTAARAEHVRVSITSLCIASGVPTTTALRWIGVMVERGLFARTADERDRRRCFIALTDKGADIMARYFDDLGTGAHYIL